MDPFLKSLFHHQIWTQCQMGMLAWGELGYRLNNRRKWDEETQAAMAALPRDLPRAEMAARAAELSMAHGLALWGPIQALLTCVANISKALWGQSGKLAAERAELREDLGVPEGSPLQPTSMRNNFDHFDDRLMEWWDRSERHNYVDLSFGDVAAGIQGIPEDELFRTYNPRTGDLVFWGNPYNLPTIVAELDRIAPLALRAALKRPGQNQG